MDFLDMPVKFTSNGDNQDAFSAFSKDEHLIRIWWQPDSYITPETAYLQHKPRHRQHVGAWGTQVRVDSE